LSLVLFLSTKVQLADIWFSLAVCQWWVWALAARKDLAARSGPKKFSEKSRSKNLQSKQILRWTLFLSSSFFRLRYFPMWTCRSKVLLDNPPMVEYLYHLRVRTVPLAIVYSSKNSFIYVSIHVNKRGARLTKFQLAGIWFSLVVCQWRIWALAARKALARRSDPKLFSEKSRSEICNRNNFTLNLVFIYI
jgi:hypothetical protein